MEELSLKDNENMPFLEETSSFSSEPQRFTPDELVPCETCRRANPPTRTNCIYCAAALPASKKISDHRVIRLKPVEDSVPGHNCIVTNHQLGVSQFARGSELLRIDSSALQKILDSDLPLPVARTTTRDEAELLCRQLADLGISSLVVTDDELGVFDATAVNQARGLEIEADGITFKQISAGSDSKVLWSEIVLLIKGRLINRRIESSEQKSKRGEKEIVEATEFFADEPVMDVYVRGRRECFRIMANRFDFSAIPQRRLVAAENFTVLINLIRERSSEVTIDDSFQSVRQSLDLVWPSGQHTGSAGWRRERPGRYSIGAITESSNLNQFTRYSRMRWFFLTNSEFANAN